MFPTAEKMYDSELTLYDKIPDEIYILYLIHHKIDIDFKSIFTSDIFIFSRKNLLETNFISI